MENLSKIPFLSLSPLAIILLARIFSCASLVSTTYVRSYVGMNDCGWKIVLPQYILRRTYVPSFEMKTKTKKDLKKHLFMKYKFFLDSLFVHWL